MDRHPASPPDTDAHQARLEALTPAARALASAAAVWEPGFELASLQQVAAMEADTLATALAELVAAEVLVCDGTGYRFAHAPLRDRLIAEWPPDTARERHAAAARVLEAPLAAGRAVTAAHLGALARHHLAAENAEAAVRTAYVAAQAHQRAGAHAEAESLLTSGLTLVRKEGRAAWGRLRLDYMIALGDVWRLTGSLAPARTLYQEALALAEALNEARLAGPLLVSLAQVMQGLDDLAEAERLGDRAVNACLAAGDRPAAARALLTAARIRLHRGAVADAQAQANRAMAIAREAEDPVRLAEALALLGYLYTAMPPKRLADGVTCLHESIAILSGQEDRGGLLLSYMLLGNAQLAMGDAPAAARSFAIARWIGQDTGNRSEEGIALVNMALASLELGRLEEALETAQQAAAHARSLESPYQQGLAAGVEALAFAHLGLAAQAFGALETAEALASAPDQRYLAALVWQWSQEARLLLGDAIGARRAGEALASVTTATGQAEAESRAHALMAETYGRLGEPVEAFVAAQRALASAEEAKAQGDQVRALRVIAWLMATDGDRAGARRLAESACGLSRQLGSAYQTAQLEGLLGELARKSEPALARVHFEAMAELADAMGCRPLQAQALAGLGDLEGARALLEGLLENTDAIIRQQFLSLPERRRILRSSGTGPLGPLDQPV